MNKVSLGVEVGLITTQLADNLAASVLVQDIMDNLEVLVKGVPQYRNDKRREIQAVTQLRYSSLFPFPKRKAILNSVTGVASCPNSH